MTDLYADDDYLAHYRFEYDPFVGRGPGFKFFAAKRQSVLAELEHLARYSKLMLVVTGPKGSGKTVLRQALVERAAAEVTSIVIVASARADAAAMLHQVSDALGLPESDIAGVLGHIERLFAAGQEVQLVVDNAEFLEESALLFLQRIAQGVNDACARVFVFSDSSVLPLLEKVADNADLHHVIVLEPWDEQETVEYIGQRLVAAGQQFDMFTGQQLAEIFARSQGWPGRINQAAKDLLLEHLAGRHRGVVKKTTATDIPYKHIALLVVLSIGLLLVWLIQTPESKQSAEQQASDQAKSVEHELSLEVIAEPVLREPLAQAVNAEDEDYSGAANEPAQELTIADSAPAAVSAPVPISTPPATAVEEKVQPVIQQPAPAAQTAAKPIPAPAAPAAKLEPKKPVPTKPAVVQEKVAPTAARVAGEGQWYKQQTASRYTLQVLSARAEATVQSFLQKHSSTQYHYYKKQHQGQALYVVTYGSFADRDAALRGINNLPESIRQNKPWPRTMLSIQQELR